MKKTLLITLTFLSLLGLSGVTQAASSCQGKSKTACSTNKSCTWVESHKRKNGTQVKAYCRSANKAANSKSKKVKTKSVSKKKDSKKKDSKKKDSKKKDSKKKDSKKKDSKKK